MKKVKTLLFALMTLISLAACGGNNSSVSDTSSQEHSSSESEQNTTTQSEESSTNSSGVIHKINASVIIDYGTIKAHKATPILDQEVEFDVAKEIATAVYGDEVIISYSENSEDCDVEVIEKEVLENITVFMSVAPGAQDDDYECYTQVSGVALNIKNIEYIINLDGSYVAKSQWSKLFGTPLYASYNPAESKQTTEFTVLHYLTALYSYNPRKVDKEPETGPLGYVGSPLDFIDELNVGFNGEYLFGEAAPSEAVYTADGFSYAPGWFGADEVRSSDEKTSYLFGGFPDVLGPYKVIELNTIDTKYKVFSEVGVGTNILEASTILMSHDYLGSFNESNLSYRYTKGRISIILTVGVEGEVINLRIRLHSVNNEDIVF